MKGFNSILGLLKLIILNVGIAAALFAVGVGLQLAWDDGAEFLELVENLLLSDTLINVHDKKICLLVELVLPLGLRLDDSEGKTHESLVIHLS